MGNTKKKYVGLVACVVAILCTVALTVGIIVKADKTNEGVIQVNYEDDYYCYGDTLDVENKVVQDIFETYETEDLALGVENNELVYTVDAESKVAIASVSSALCMAADQELQLEEESFLYLGEKEDCNYDENSGKAISEFDNKWILVNNELPIAMYNESVDETTGNKEYITAAYINEDSFASNIKLSVDANNIVTVVGKIIDKDVDGNPLEEVQIEALESGDTLCPAYVSFDYGVTNITNAVMEATEVYNENTYTYGSNFDLAYTSLPDNFYLYSMRTNYADDTTTEEVEEEFGFFTEPKKISIVNEEVVEIKDAQINDVTLEGYEYMGVVDFMKQVWAHKKANTKQELDQAFCHKIDGVQKGYISTWNSLGINKALRTDTVPSLDADDQLTITTLDTMCKKISSQNDYLMLRKVSADYLSNVFGVKSKDGQTLSDEMVKGYSDADKLELETRLQEIVGDKMVEKGFMSASMIPYVNIIFGRTVEIVIKVPAGSKYYVSHNVVESEAIFPPGTELTVESVKYNDKKGKYIIIAKLSQNY